MTPTPVGPRDQLRERRWLVLAELTAGRSGFSRHALMRLAAGDRAYGDQWTNRTVDELLGELTEEAADIGSWGVLALQALADAHTLGAERRERIAALLEDALTAGAHAHRALVGARREIARAIPENGAATSRPRAARADRG